MAETQDRVRRLIPGRRTRTIARNLWSWETIAGFVMVIVPLLIGAAAGAIANAETRATQRSVGIVDVLINNGILALVLIGGTFSLGLPAIFLIPGWFVNGYTIGSALAAGHFTEFAIHVLPHALVEISGFALATAAGFSGIRIAVRYVSKHKTTGSESTKKDWRVLTEHFTTTATLGLALIIVGAVIEGTISRP